MGIKRVTLEDQRDVSVAWGKLRYAPLSYEDVAGIRPLETCHAAHRRRLAAAGRTEQADELPVAHVEINVVNRSYGVEILAQSLDSNVSHGRILPIGSPIALSTSSAIAVFANDRKTTVQRL
jgi:hypothetical protein